MIKFNCPSCGGQLSAPDSALGRKAKCKHCNSKISIAAPASTTKKALTSVRTSPSQSPQQSPPTKPKPLNAVLFQLHIKPLGEGKGAYKLGLRHFALIVDFIAVFIAVCLIMATFQSRLEAFEKEIAAGNNDVKQAIGHVFAFFFLFLTWLLLGLTEAFFGTSLGKMATRIHIVGVDGRRATTQSLLKRYALKHIGLLIGVGLLGTVGVLLQAGVGLRSLLEGRGVGRWLLAMLFFSIGAWSVNVRYDKQLYWDFLADTRVWRIHPRPSDEDQVELDAHKFKRITGTFLIIWGGLSCLVFPLILFDTNHSLLMRITNVVLGYVVFAFPMMFGGVWLRRRANQLTREAIIQRKQASEQEREIATPIPYEDP